MRRWVIPIIAAVVLFGYVATHRDPIERPDPPAAAGPSAGPGLPRLTGTEAFGPPGLKVLVSGRYPQIIDTSIGHSGPVPGLQLAPGERAALLAVPAGTVAAVTGPGTSRIRTVLLRPVAPPPVPLGVDVTVVPAHTGTDLFVATRRAGSTSVAQVRADGKVRRRWTAGGTLTPLRDTAAGLVAGQVGDLQAAQLRLLDPATGAERRRLATGRIQVAVGPDAVAHVSGTCARDCPVTVTRLADGVSRDYRMPAGTGNPARGAFSPDGRWLALGVPGQYRNGRLVVVPGFAEVVDLAAGTVTRVPGVETEAERSADLSWFRDTLVLGVWSDSRGQVAAWTPSRPADGLRILPADPPGDEALSTVTVL
ncbi:MAG TPA: hypothetical protein VI357_14150 [Mycobacteriales bacterium]